jgi:hypothetical protein
MVRNPGVVIGTWTPCSSANQIQMSLRKVKLCFNATIDEENGSMEMSVDWEANIEFAVAVLCTAAAKHPQIYEALVLAASTLEEKLPKTEEQRMKDVIMSTLSDMDEHEVSDEDKEMLLAKLMSMSSKGDA